MEAELIKAGWEKKDFQLYAHKTLGELFRSDRNGRWYRRRRGRADELMGRTLKDAITKALAIKPTLF
jgi:hypothetical protein